MKVTKSNVTAASDWLKAMADAASELAITIQYCMPLARHMLESTLHAAVTNARASGDYHPGASNFQVGLSSLFYWAIGIAPSKDDWWSTEVQPGNPYGDKPTEPNWQLQALVVGLSTGPNGPSDGIGYTNASLVFSTIRGDGLTLQPDRPSTAMDIAILQAFSPSGVPDVRSTWTAYARHAYRWHFILSTSLPAAGFPLTLTDLQHTGDATRFAVFNWFNPLAGPLAVLSTSNPTAGFTIPGGQGQPSAPAAAHNIQYFVVIPQLPGGWWLYGEVGKVVPMSKQRVADLALFADGFSASILGSAGEAKVSMLVIQTNATLVACPSAAGKTALLTCRGAAPCTCL
jgi:hypothetical protein